MQQEAGLRLKSLGGRLACWRLPISLVHRATEWSCYGTACATPLCLPGWALAHPGRLSPISTLYQPRCIHWIGRRVAVLRSL